MAKNLTMKNTYRVGCAYHAIMALIMDKPALKRIVTKQELIDEGFKMDDITVVLSPTKEKLGNRSAHGKNYFFARLKKKDGEAQRFQLRRCERDGYPSRKSGKDESVEAQQTKAIAKVQTKAKPKAKSKAKTKKDNVVKA